MLNSLSKKTPPPHMNEMMRLVLISRIIIEHDVLIVMFHVN